MGERVDIQRLEADLAKLEQSLGMTKEKPPLEEGLYQKIFGEGIMHNVDEFYGISPKAKWAWEKLLGLVPEMGRKPTYMPKTAPEDRRWLEGFLKNEEL